jgi:hypothetical protein
MDDTNNILAKIDTALRDDETPRWAIPVLLCMRDDHTKLHAHLAAHRDWSQPVRQIVVSVATALAVALALWFAAGRLPAVFGP